MLENLPLIMVQGVVVRACLNIKPVDLLHWV